MNEWVSMRDGGTFLYNWNTWIYTDAIKHTRQFDGLARMSEKEGQDS